MVRAHLPNKRLKLPAPTSKGNHLFVNDTALRRSLGASRYAAHHVLQIIC